MTKTEKAFYVALIQNLPRYYNVFSKVRIEDFIDALYTNASEKNMYRNPIKSRHIDFLICDTYSAPLFAIELDGNTHITKKQKDIDEKKNKICKEAGIPLLRVQVGKNFSEEANIIKNRLFSLS